MFNNLTRTYCTFLSKKCIYFQSKKLPSTKCFKTRTIKENAELNVHKNRGTWRVVRVQGRNCSLWGWQGPGTGCPGKLWLSHPWKWPKPVWMGLRVTWSNGRCSWLWKQVGIQRDLRSLQPKIILWSPYACKEHVVLEEWAQPCAPPKASGDRSETEKKWNSNSEERKSH